MKQQIYFYKLYLFGHKENDFIYLSQTEGQKLSMILSTDATRKFVFIGDDVVNTSAIEQLIKCEEQSVLIEKGLPVMVKEKRELTDEERKIQDIFDNFKYKNKLLK